MFRKHKTTNRGKQGNNICVQLLINDERGTVGGLEPLGMYERLVICMSLTFLSQVVGLSKRTSYRSRVINKIRVFHVFERGLWPANSLSFGTSVNAVEPVKSLDLATCSAILKEFTQTAPMF